VDGVSPGLGVLGVDGGVLGVAGGVGLLGGAGSGVLGV
jgi:hypothetical protein